MPHYSTPKAALWLLIIGPLTAGCLQIAVSGHAATSGSASSAGLGSAGGSTTGTTARSSPDGGSCTATPGFDLDSQNGSFPSLQGVGIANSADLDGDGFLDVVLAGAANGGSVAPGFYVAFGTADGSLSAPTYYRYPAVAAGGPLLTADVNGDGRPDVLWGGGQPDSLIPYGIQVAWNAGGTFRSIAQLVAIPTQNLIVGLAVADLNQDGLMDIVDGEATPSNYVVNAFLGQGKGYFSAAIPLAELPQEYQTGYPTALALADLNRDGFPDILTAGWGSSQLAVLLHQSDGGYQTSFLTFPAPVTIATLLRPGAAPDLVAGYNANGNVDPPNGEVEILANAGDGTFSHGQPLYVPNLAQEIAVADFDGDCILDLAVGAHGCVSQAGVSVFLGDPKGGFEVAFPLPSPPGGTAQLSLIGPATHPRALATTVPCGSGPGMVVYGNAAGP